jgi:pSer/pThr/pTyr-binding forkhead associated (FHA) protein
MSRIAKLFGRKDDQASETEGGTSDQVPSLANTGKSPQGVHGASDQGFGLQFQFASGESKTFTSLPISIGRSKQNDIILSDETVSAVHARVYYDEQVKDVCILDNDSLNGLFIDDQPTRKNVLHDGVRIRIGSVELTFRDTGYLHSV